MITLGKKQFVIDQSDLIRGASSSMYAKDGGFSPESASMNLNSLPGVLQPMASRTLVTSNLNGDIINSIPAQNTFYRYFFTTNNRLEYMNSGTSITDSQALTGTLHRTYSDICQFGTGSSDTDIFITTNTNIIKSTPSSGVPGAQDATWWTGTKGKTALVTGYWHGMIVYENAMWIADANFIHKWDGTTASYQALILPYNQAITAFGIDPGTGKMLIGVTEGQNAQGSVPMVCKILVWDGTSNKPLRSIPVDGMVTSFTNLGGTVYVGYGTRFGYWNGGGITFLRKLDINWDNDFLIWKNKITIINDKIYIAEGKKVLVYGSITPGKQKQFYYLFDCANPVSGFFIDTSYINHIMNLGGSNSQTNSEYFGAQWTGGGTAVLSKIDLMSYATSVGNMYFVSNYYEFQRPITIKEVYFELIGTVNASAVPFTFSVCAAGSTSALNSNTSVTNDKTNSQSVLRLPLANGLQVYGTRFVLAQNTQYTSTVWGIKRIIVYYDDE